MIVVDASVLANVVGDDEESGRTARQGLRGIDGVAAPDLVDVETVAVLRKRWLATTISEQRFASAIADLERIDIERVPTPRLMRRAYELRSNVTPYDASYVALAELLDCELWTADERLANAPGPRCIIRLIG